MREWVNVRESPLLKFSLTRMEKLEENVYVNKKGKRLLDKNSLVYVSVFVI